MSVQIGSKICKEKWQLKVGEQSDGEREVEDEHSIIRK